MNKERGTERGASFFCMIVTCVHRRFRERLMCHRCHGWPRCPTDGCRKCGLEYWPTHCDDCCRSHHPSRGCRYPSLDGCRCSLRDCGCRCHYGSHCGCRRGSSFRCCDCCCDFRYCYGCHGPWEGWACRSGVRHRSCHPCGCGHP